MNEPALLQSLAHFFASLHLLLQHVEGWVHESPIFRRLHGGPLSVVPPLADVPPLVELPPLAELPPLVELPPLEPSASAAASPPEPLSRSGASTVLAASGALQLSGGDGSVAAWAGGRWGTK